MKRMNLLAMIVPLVLSSLSWAQSRPADANAPASAPAVKPVVYKFHDLAGDAIKQKPYVQARSFDLHYWPFLDGQWEGIVADSEGNVWFGVSTHCGTQHGQLFRYNHKEDIVEHVADLGQACGEALSGNPPQDKIHGQMFEEGDHIFAGTCEGHVIDGKPYKGGYWLRIDKKTGVVTNLGMTVTKDGLLCVGYDPYRKILYGHTNRTGELTVLDPNTGKERVLGVPWQDCIDAWKADPDPKKPKDIWPRGLTVMPTPGGKVYGVKPGCTFWEYDPATEKIQNIAVEMPIPDEVTQGDKAAVARWKTSACHITLWDPKDQCFYTIRSYDEMLCRFFPPDGNKPARLEAVQRMGLPDSALLNRGSRFPSCTLVMVGRTIYYNAYSGWGGTTDLQSYNLDTGKFTDHGPIVVDGDRRVNECQSMAAGKDGRLYLVAFVFSIEGKDPANPWGMRGPYPFHPRFTIIDPQKDFQNAAK